MTPEEDIEQGEGDAVVTACELDAPPETVWRTLTEPHLVAEWLMTGDVRPEIGARFSLGPAGPGRPAIACEVLAADPPRRLAYTWREEGAPGSVVTFELAPAEPGRTRLRIVHRAARRSAGTMAALRRPRRAALRPLAPRPVLRGAARRLAA